LYKDGKNLTAGYITQGIQITPGGALVIGQEQDSVEGGFSIGQAFLGTIDEIKIYDRALNALEICASCNAQGPAVGVTCNC